VKLKRCFILSEFSPFTERTGRVEGPCVWFLKVSATIAFAAVLISCSRLHSRAITLQLVNASPAPVANLAFDFPGGSFGVDTIAPGATRSKWFKPTSTGPLKVEFDDQSGHHSEQLITLQVSESGTVTATFFGSGKVQTSKSSKTTPATNP
jgi:hypothetical protein